MLTVKEVKDGYQLVFPKEFMGCTRLNGESCACILGFKDKDREEIRGRFYLDFVILEMNAHVLMVRLNF